ncbi:MAG: sulfotransferase [Coprococcus sp.]|nr:sulfotransferase [Coprococcus sp.]
MENMYQTESLYDYEAQNILFIRRAIQKRIEQGIKQFAILPAGFWGRMTRHILEKEFHIEPQACFDNFSFYNQDIHPVSEIRSMCLSDTVFLVAVEKEEWRGLLYQQIAPFIPDSFIELIPILNAEQKRIFEESKKVHLDFLCPGFHKCSTTSLQAALRQNKNIFLPDVKETFFITEITESTHKKFRQNYQDNNGKSIGVLNGGIEPTYLFYAASVYQYFGRDLKILFLVRNPVEALKSAFKMSMREADKEGFELIEKYGKMCPDLMKEYIETYYWRFLYINFIRIYERYYPKTQIKIVLSEELIQDPSEQMETIQEFIGLPKELRIDYEEFPYENRGDTVFKDLGGAYVNHTLNMLRMNVESVPLYLRIDEIRKEVFDITTADFNFEQYEDIWETVYDYYADSIKSLEERMGRSLEGVWY